MSDFSIKRFDEPGKIRVYDARLSYPKLFHPDSFSIDQKPKFSASIILKENDPQVEQIREVIEEVKKAQWPRSAPRMARELIRDGAEKDQDGYGPGVFFINANNDVRPKLRGKYKNEEVSEEDGIFYAGCYVDVILQIWAQDNRYGKAINAALLGVQFRRAGEPMAGGRSAKDDDFEDIDDETDDLLA